MYKDLPGYFAPQNHECKIWRYMPFWIFEDLINTRKLYLCRLDKLEDEYEGTLPAIFDLSNEHLYPPGQAKVLKRKAIETIKKEKVSRYINSWHINEVESEFMWRGHAAGGDGITIQSTFNKLKESFNETLNPETIEDIFISVVKYHKFDQTTMTGLGDKIRSEIGVAHIQPSNFKQTKL